MKLPRSPLLALALLAAGPLAAADGLDDARRKEFKERDDNRDGSLTRAEYGGHPGNFRALDRNDDGSLSLDEFVNRQDSAAAAATPAPAPSPEPTKRPGGRKKDEFERTDTNENGSIDPQEWPATPADWARVDRDHDGKISHEEWLTQLDPNSLQGRFAARDLDGDGFLTRKEWTDTDAIVAVDTDKDGRVSLQEYRTPRAAAGRRGERRTGARPAELDQRFDVLDRNGDGVLVAQEWRDDKFTFRDADRDGNEAISREEFRLLFR